MPRTDKRVLKVWGESHTRRPDFKDRFCSAISKMPAKYHPPEFCSQRVVFGKVMCDLICNIIDCGKRTRQVHCLVYGGTDVSDAYRKYGAGPEFDNECNRLVERFRTVMLKAKDTPGCSLIIAGLIPRPRDDLLRDRYSEVAATLQEIIKEHFFDCARFVGLERALGVKPSEPLPLEFWIKDQVHLSLTGTQLCVDGLVKGLRYQRRNDAWRDHSHDHDQH